MAFSDSEVHSIISCAKSCSALKEYEKLKKQYDEQRLELNQTSYNLSNHKRGLAVLEEQILHYRENESKFNDDIAVLKRDLDYKIAVNVALREELEKVTKANENIQITCNTLDHQSKCIDKIWEAQVVNKAKSGIGYKSVPPPYRGVPSPPGIDLAHTGLEEFQEPQMIYGQKSSPKIEKTEETKECFESASDTSLVDEDVSKAKSEIKVDVNNVPKVAKIENNKPVRNTVRYAEMYRSQPRGNQRNWNNMKSQQLGSDFVMLNKACFVCGSFDHLSAYCEYNPWKKVTSRDTRVFGNKQPRVNNYVSNHTHSNVKIIPRSVVLNSGTRQFCSARQNKTMYPRPTVSRAKPKFSNYKQAQTVNKSFLNKTARSNQKWVPKVSTAKPAVPTVRPKVPTDRQKKAVKGNMGNGMIATAQWVWRPITGDKASMVLKKHTYIDARGRVKSVMAWVSNV